MKKLGLLLFSVFLLGANLCSAQNDCVYTAGFTRDASGRQYAAYWKSGQLTKLAGGTNRDEARTIAVSGYSVHVGGFKINGVNRVAAYWLNGQQMPLNLTGNYSGLSTEVNAIKTVGSDVYLFVTQPKRMSNSEPNNYYYYKNGIRQTLVLSDYQPVNQALTKSQSFFVTRNGDVYIVNPGLIDNKITYWKNGNRVSAGLSYATLDRVDINSIFVSDYGDVYIAGTKISKSGSAKAAYWKNGTEVAVSYDAWNTYTTGIYVEGSAVYVAGYETKAPSHFSAVYWKNGYKTVLHNYDTDGYDATTTSIASAYGTVYVAGMHKNLVYWVNGKAARLDQPSGEIYAMAVVNGGGCINNTQSVSVATPNNQSVSSINQVRQQQQVQQQQPVTEDIKQLAEGISGLMASIRADKERRLAEEKQAALAKSAAERQLQTDADNGVYKAQIETAEKYFAESKYYLAEDYYMKAFENPNATYAQRNEVLDELIGTLALQEKKKEIFELFNHVKISKIENYKVDQLLTLLKIHCNEFGAGYLPCSDSITQEGINGLIKIKNRDDLKALYAYFQVTGNYEKFGIPKDEKQGLKTLEDITDDKYNYNKPSAYYYLGMIYLNGTATIKVNEKKALNNFKKGYYGKEKQYHFAPAYSTYLANRGYFNYDLLNYMKIAILYSKSEDKDDSELGRKMLNSFSIFYKGMIPNSDKEYFKS